MLIISAKKRYKCDASHHNIHESDRMRISLLCNTRIMSEDVAQNRVMKRRNSLHGYYLLLVDYYCSASEIFERSSIYEISLYLA